MKRLKTSSQDKIRNEGRTQVELAAEIRRRAYRLYEERGRADGHGAGRLGASGSRVLEQDRKSAAA